ncbi:uncharacterized protein LOC107875317 isoform X2 [Capsicum annuum]|uniref:uncharacterized protein LOC107875317 isoform X2 n=1 Tax=Capsicum annuum TaxID=4072 RepID=UPI001FB05209|nr:uncharacterized protein LOC107875317 isoform X2 [Capsicum annuum]XP_047251829.1 uncharacterized protein LOC107875317 isoform X2 [Capsicum annuum]XP_047251839.1 uncharacterized protein LOC107875317 isoform X2 [Capsicum annuum]
MNQSLDWSLSQLTDSSLYGISMTQELLFHGALLPLFGINWQCCGSCFHIWDITIKKWLEILLYCLVQGLPGGGHEEFNSRANFLSRAGISRFSNYNAFKQSGMMSTSLMGNMGDEYLVERKFMDWGITMTLLTIHYIEPGVYRKQPFYFFESSGMDCVHFTLLRSHLVRLHWICCCCCWNYCGIERLDLIV